MPHNHASRQKDVDQKNCKGHKKLIIGKSPTVFTNNRTIKPGSSLELLQNSSPDQFHVIFSLCKGAGFWVKSLAIWSKEISSMKENEISHRQRGTTLKTRALGPWWIFIQKMKMQRMSKFVRKGKTNHLLAGGSLVRKAEALERETQVHQKVKVTNRGEKKKKKNFSVKTYPARYIQQKEISKSLMWRHPKSF